MLIIDFHLVLLRHSVLLFLELGAQIVLLLTIFVTIGRLLLVKFDVLVRFGLRLG